MDDYESLSPTKWECKYHVVSIPKYRRKLLYGELGQYVWEVFASWRCRRKAGSNKVTSCRITSATQQPLRAAPSLKILCRRDGRRGYRLVSAPYTST
jgi:hypothetical protein